MTKLLTACLPAPCHSIPPRPDLKLSVGSEGWRGLPSFRSFSSMMAGLVRASPSSDGRCCIPAGESGLETRGDFRSIRPVRHLLLVRSCRAGHPACPRLQRRQGGGRESGGHPTSFRPKLLRGFLLTHATGASGTGGGGSQKRGRKDRGPGTSRGGIQEGGGRRQQQTPTTTIVTASVSMLNAGHLKGVWTRGGIQEGGGEARGEGHASILWRCLSFLPPFASEEPSDQQRAQRSDEVTVLTTAANSIPCLKAKGVGEGGGRGCRRSKRASLQHAKLARFPKQLLWCCASLFHL